MNNENNNLFLTDTLKDLKNSLKKFLENIEYLEYFKQCEIVIPNISYDTLYIDFIRKGKIYFDDEDCVVNIDELDLSQLVALYCCIVGNI